MKFTRSKPPRSKQRSVAGLLAAGVALLTAACAPEASTETDSLDDVGSTSEAVVGADCGYSLVATVTKVTKKGFRAKIKIKRTDGGRLDSTGFNVLVDSGAAKLVRVGHGTYAPNENGYLLSTITPPECDEDRDGDDEDANDPDVLAGRAYRFHLKFEGAYTKLAANLMASGGVACDQGVPTIKLATSGDFFTSNATLTLSATAADNVAVSKVVFAQDGVELGTVRTAPYTLAVPVTNARNSRHRYTATAYDLTGNQASETKRVLVAIGNKFLGTATTDAADYAGLLAHFNQVTPGNAGKWGSVEATRDQMNFTDLDIAYNFAKQNHLPFKLHTLVWGSQQPTWVAALPPAEQLAELEQWMTALAARYPDTDLIDVVNEPLHAVPSYSAALGGAGVTGWDWVVTAFEMARSHFPNAELLLNEYAVLTMASTTTDYLKIVKVLSDRGLIDGIGEQGHFYERAPELSVLTTNFNALVATGLPLYITELDLNYSDDALQARRMKDLFSTFWSAPSVLGVTHWGYREGNMWQTNAYLVRSNGSARPALSVIECYRAGGTDCPVPEYVPQPRTGDAAGLTLEAEEYDSAHALLPAGNMVAYASDGSWFGFDKVVFDANWDALEVKYAQGGSNPVTLAIHLGSLETAPVAHVTLPPSGDWSTMKTVSIPWAPLSGEGNVFVRFQGGGANVDKLKFVAPSGTGKNLLADSDFELGTTGGFWSWGSGNIANTTARAASGSHALAMTARTGNSPLVSSLTALVAAGKTYHVSLLASVGGATSAAYVTTALQCSGGETTYGRLGGWDNSKSLSDGSWQEFAGDIAVPDCALANVAFWLEGPGAGVDLYIDHVSVRAQINNNIVANGTFEAGTTGWFTWGGAALSATTERFHGGSSSLLVGNRTGNSPAAIDLTSAVKPGTNYPLSLWVSLRNADGTNQSVNVTQATSCRAADGTVNTTYAWISGPTAISGGASSWVQFTGTVAVPNCTLTQLQLFVEGAVGADLFVDDVQVLDNSAGPSNLITDGTFETSQGAWGGWGFASLSVVNTAAHAGTKSLLGASMQYGAIARDIKAVVTPGKRYQATAWVSVGNLAAGSGAVKFQTVQRCNGAAGDSYPWLAGETVTNGAWKQVVGTVDLTGCTTVDNLLLFVGADSGDLYVDDVTLTPVP